MRLQVSISLQDLRWRAEATLDSAILYKGFLKRVQAPGGGGEGLQAFYRQYIFPNSLACSYSAGLYGFPIEEHGTNAAVTLSTAIVDAINLLKFHLESREMNMNSH